MPKGTKKGSIHKYKMKHPQRPICTACHRRPVAINYYKGKKVHYRSQCDKCIRVAKQLNSTERAGWESSGYKKKSYCEKCAFVADNDCQLEVYNTDGDMTNNNWRNLKTVCANCIRILHLPGQRWRQGDLSPD